jgi:hypothetical protein
MKKKTFIFVTFILVMMLFILNPAGAAEKEFRIYIGNELLNFTEDMGKPFIDSQNRTQIPLRAVSEGLGYEVNYDHAKKTININKSDEEGISLTIGSNKVKTPRGTIIMDTEAVIIGKRTYVPLRFVNEALGNQVIYQWKGYHSIKINEPVSKVVFYRPENQYLPDEIVNWIEYSKELPLVQEKVYDGKRYILITEGMKPTGGYSVEIKEMEIVGNELVVKVKSTSPGKGDYVTQAVTYPYDLVVVNNHLPLKFVDVDNKDRYFMGLIGMDEIDRPIVAASEWIKVFEPKPLANLNKTFKLAGIANVFEGTVCYELRTDTGDVVLDGFTTAAMGDWAYFEEKIQVPEEVEETEFTLELYSESAKDGSRIFKIEIPLIIE